MRINIRILNLGMSGAKWVKTGGFDTAPQASAFLHYWWQQLSAPERWELSIDGLDYQVVPPFPKETSEAHISYCCEFHCAFYTDGMEANGVRSVPHLEKGTMECL